jgi:hypothetical protein
MICPQCHAEYRAGFTRCSDCDIALVDHLPPVESGVEPELEPTEESDYVAVATVQGQLEEDQIRAFLESNDIPCEVRGGMFRNVYPVNIDGIGAIEILVPKDLVDRALDLLEKADHGDLAIDSADQ